MRPPKKVLILSDDEEEGSILRYALWVNSTYRPILAEDATSATELLGKGGIKAIVLLGTALGAQKVIESANSFDPRVCIFYAANRETEKRALRLEIWDRMLVNPSTAEILAWLTIATVCNRGPKKGSFVPLPPDKITLDSMAMEAQL